MKKLILVFFVLANLANAMGEYFVEEFDNNDNKWHLSKNSREELLIKDGNYIIRNLDTESDLSVSTSSFFSDFFSIEYRLKPQEYKEEVLYGVFIELETKDKFYLILNGENIAYFYEKEKDINIIDKFEKFPYISKDDYNHITFIKDNDTFTFLINEIPTEKIWTIKDSKIKKMGIYLNSSSTVLLDRYTEFSI